MLKKWLSGNGKNIQKSAVIWNAIGGMFNAGQSAIVLIFISHQLGIVTAGMVTYAFAVAQLFLAIAKYGVRNYQVTDVGEKYSFGDYFFARVVSVGAALVMLAVYLLYEFQVNDDFTEKGLIILAIVLMKLIDAAEDVYLGRLQQVGRLDIGAKIMALRLIFITAVICLVVVAGGGIHLALWLAVAFSVLIDVICIYSVRSELPADRQKTSKSGIISLLKVCFPLCLGMTLSIYIGNAPKYMINAYMDETTQAIFGYIMMPVFVITLLNQFIYQPLVKGLGDLWKQKEIKKFRQSVMKQAFIVIALTAVVMVAGLTAGLPILSVMYAADLTQYRLEFAVLLMGGGAYALAYYLNVPITTIRRQNYIAVGYAVAAVLAFVAGRFFVKQAGMLGAAILYLCVNVLLVATYSAVLFYGMKKDAGNAD